jgi:hypothetical protein
MELLSQPVLRLVVALGRQGSPGRAPLWGMALPPRLVDYKLPAPSPVAAKILLQANVLVSYTFSSQYFRLRHQIF